jgi:hypothetical protein
MLKQIIIIPSSNTLFNSPFNITLLLSTTQPTLRKKCSISHRSLLDKSNNCLINEDTLGSFMESFTDQFCLLKTYAHSYKTAFDGNNS